MTNKVSRLKPGCISARTLLGQRLGDIKDTDTVLIVVRSEDGNYEMYSSDGMSTDQVCAASLYVQGFAIKASHGQVHEE